MKRFTAVLSLLAIVAVGSVSALRAKEPAVGAPAPDFALQDLDGNARALSSFRGKYVVLEWINHGCPFVKKHYDSGNMQALQREMTGKDVVWLSICSSAEGKEGYETPADWKKLNVEKSGAATAVLLDTDGKVGLQYGAKTTPHMFVIDPAGVLVYKGAIDDKPSTEPADVTGAKNYVRAAVDDAKAGRKVATPSTTPYGCSVKYKK